MFASVISWPHWWPDTQMSLAEARDVFFPAGLGIGRWTDQILAAWAAEDIALAARTGEPDAPLVLLRYPPQEGRYGFTLSETARLVHRKADGSARAFHDVYMVNKPGVVELNDPLASGRALPAPLKPLAKEGRRRGKSSTSPATAAFRSRSGSLPAHHTAGAPTADPRLCRVAEAPPMGDDRS